MTANSSDYGRLFFQAEVFRAAYLAIAKGEIFALLGPNGAGKTTLIGAICGTVSMTSGSVRVAGFDVVRDFLHGRPGRQDAGPLSQARLAHH